MNNKNTNGNNEMESVLKKYSPAKIPLSVKSRVFEHNRKRFLINIKLASAVAIFIVAITLTTIFSYNNSQKNLYFQINTEINEIAQKKQLLAVAKLYKNSSGRAEELIKEANLKINN